MLNFVVLWIYDGHPTIIPFFFVLSLVVNLLFPFSYKTQFPPSKAGVKRLGPSCDDTLGSEGIARVHATREYAAEYNRLMYEHNSKTTEPKPADSKPGDNSPKAAQ